MNRFYGILGDDEYEDLLWRNSKCRLAGVYCVPHYFLVYNLDVEMYE